MFGTITLPIALRSRAAALSQYPCTSCHQGRKVVMANKRISDAHNNIQPVHPDQTGAVCSTCHSADDVELLTLKSGERATLDESYRLCAQCHFEQADAWAGGGAWQTARRLGGAARGHGLRRLSRPAQPRRSAAHPLPRAADSSEPEATTHEC